MKKNRRKMHNRMLASLLCIIMILLLVAGCSANGEESGGEGTSEKDTEGLTLGKIPITLASTVHQADVEWEAKFAEEEGAEVVVIDGESDASVMNNAIENLMVQGVDGIIVTPQDTSAIVAVVEEARAQGIPVITYYRNIEGLELPWIRVYEKDNAYKMGVDCATKWQEYYPDKPIKMAIIEYLTDPTTIEMRSAAFIEGVQSVAPDAEVVVSMDGNGDRQTSVSIGEDILQSHPEVNIVYGTSAAHSLGVLSAFEAAGRGKAEDGVPLTEFFCGTDASEDELLKLVNPNSSFKFTMGMTPKDNAKTQVETFFKVVSGEIPMDEETIIDVTNKNFDYWQNSAEEIQEWYNDQYNADWDLIGELESITGN